MELVRTHCFEVYHALLLSRSDAIMKLSGMGIMICEKLDNQIN